MAKAPNPWDYAEKSGKEHAHQAALFMWANMARMFGLHLANVKSSYTEPGWAKGQADSAPHLVTPVPQLKWMHAIHNQGHGDIIRGSMAKAEGVKAGVFDIFLPVPLGDEYGHFFSGLYLEMKVGNNKESNQQLEFKADMTQAGYACSVAVGWLEARNKVLDYLGLPTYTLAINSEG